MALLPLAALRRPCAEVAPAADELRYNEVENVCKVGELLGQGGFGEVRHATLFSGRSCALKVVSKVSDLAAEMARSEARALERLSGPGIVQLYDAFEDDDCVYLVLELVEGQDLCEAFRGPLPEASAKRLAQQVLEAVSGCHAEGFLHRDLKPENLMLTGDIHTGSLKLIDFGLALECTPGALTRADVAGTPGYLAPEAQRGVFSGASDVFACGKVLEKLLGCCASPAASALLEALLHPNAEQRPTADEALQYAWFQEAPASENFEAVRTLTEADVEELTLQMAPSCQDACHNDAQKAVSRSSTRGTASGFFRLMSSSATSQSSLAESDAEFLDFWNDKEKLEAHFDTLHLWAQEAPAPEQGGLNEAGEMVVVEA